MFNNNSFWNLEKTVDILGYLNIFFVVATAVSATLIFKYNNKMEAATGRHRNPHKRKKKIWEKLSIILGILAAILTVCLTILGSKVSTSKENEAKAQIANANLQAENAKAISAKANNGAEIAKANAAQANQATSEIQKQNLELATKLAKITKESNTEKQKLFRMQIEVANAQTKQIQAEKDLLLLNKKIAPRKITNQQQSSLINLINKIPEGFLSIQAITGDGEAYQYAEKLLNIFKEAGWKRVSGIISTAEEFPYGLLIITGRQNNNSTYVMELERVFEQTDLESLTKGPAFNEATPPNEVILYIGHKPNK